MANTIITGRKPVIEALRAGTQIEKILILTGIQGRVIEEIRTLAGQRGVQLAEVNKQRFREVATDSTTQGVVAVIPERTFIDLDTLLAAAAAQPRKGFLLILDEIEDPHNLGALVRTAECAGAHGVIVPRHHSAPVTGTVIKASAGATEYVPMAEVTNIVSTIKTLKDTGYWIVGLDGTADKHYAAVDYTSPVALVVGNEGKGIRRLVRENCDHLVKIPLLGRIASLNASVAGAVVMFEVVRQREENPGVNAGDV